LSKKALTTAQKCTPILVDKEGINVVSLRPFKF